MQVGLRGDHRKIDTQEHTTDEIGFPSLSRSYSNLNYSVGGVMTGDRTTYRVNLSSGFRAPNTSELLSNGVHEGTQRYEIGNPDLTSEKATQIDFTIDYNTEHISFSLNPFINFIDNYIYLSPEDSLIDNVPVYSYLQTNARLYGGEIGFHYHPHNVHWLHIESNLSAVIAENSAGNPLPLIPATRINTMLKAEFSLKGKIQINDIFLQHIYKFDQDRTSEFETPSPSYNLINIGADVTILIHGKPILVSAGIKNLFNTRYIDHLSRLKSLDIPNPGINVYLGIKFGFQNTIGKS